MEDHGFSKKYRKVFLKMGFKILNYLKKDIILEHFSNSLNHYGVKSESNHLESI